MPAEARLLAGPAEAALRLDQFIASRLEGITRSRAQRLIRAGQVSAGSLALKPSLPVPVGCEIRVVLPDPEPAHAEPENLPLTILYEDEAIAVIDKPAGMVVHPAAGHTHGTLVNALLHHVGGLSGIGGQLRPGIVHRLDKGTSGVMVIAKHDRAHRTLTRQFHDREVLKEYLALVWGVPKSHSRFDTPIGRDPNNRKKMSSRARGGRVAFSEIVDVEAFRGVSLIRVSIGTGRTHQIRVHLSEAGHPLVGDSLYGGRKARLPTHLAPIAALDRPFLHSARLSFVHPDSGRRIEFIAPLPAALERIVNALHASNGRR